MSQLAGAVPRSWVEWTIGPTVPLHIDVGGSVLGRSRSRWRPVDVLVAPALVLTRRLAIPSEARRELRSAISLLVRSETPFRPDEVLSRAVDVDGVQDTGSLNFTVLLVPRLQVDNALRAHGIDRSRVRTILPAAQEDADIDLAASYQRPWHRHRRWSWSLPVLIIVGAIATWVHAEVDVRRRESLAIEVLITEQISKLKAVAAELDELRGQSEKVSAAAEAIAASVPSLEILAAVRDAQQSTTEILRIELRDRNIRLLVKTADALGEARLMGKALPGRAVAVDGTITTDSELNVETATIVIAPGS